MVTKSKQETPKAAIKSSDKMILFVENQDLMSLPSEVENYKKITKYIYQQFGGVTTGLPMFKTTGKVFLFGEKGNFWKVDANHFKKRTAMVLFDGKNKTPCGVQFRKISRAYQSIFFQRYCQKKELLREQFSA